ncbi:MAG: GNAT family N-acetyltransferase [Fidelibacterota bacterium]|nr:MAG: GNAT family N-acetyltransferase [Candidatus Neomarinimicrobiota bacterium]
MSITVSPYQPAFSEEWDRYVHQSNNGTIFHLRRFLSYHPEDRFQDHSLLLQGPKGLLALFPAAERVVDGRRQLVSHPGASYGGLVTPIGLSFKNSYDLVESLIDYAAGKGFDNITLTLTPTIYNRRLSNYVDFALLKHGFTYLKREVSSILFLEETPEENLAKFTPASQRAVRKAQQSELELRFSQDYTIFYDILLHNLKRRHNVQPTHTLEELLRLVDLFPDDIRQLGAYLDDRMIAGITIFDANPDVTLAFYISHDEAYQQYRAVNLLFYEMICWAISNGFRYMDFGIFTVSMDPNFGLARFKESFGASGMFRDTLTLDLT